MITCKALYTLNEDWLLWQVPEFSTVVCPCWRSHPDSGIRLAGNWRRGAGGWGWWRLGRHLKWTDIIPISGRFHVFSRLKTVVDKVLTCIHIIDFNYFGWGRKSCNDAWGTHQFPKILISGLLIAFSIVKGNAKYSPFSTYNCHQNFSNSSALQNNVWRYISAKLRPSSFRTITQDKFHCVPHATWWPYFIFLDYLQMFDVMHLMFCDLIVIFGGKL